MLSVLQSEPINVLVTGAAGQIAYSLLFSIAKGDVFGKDQVKKGFVLLAHNSLISLGSSKRHTHTGHWQLNSCEYHKFSRSHMYVEVTLNRCCPVGSDQVALARLCALETRKDCPWSQWNVSGTEALGPTFKPLDPFGTWATWLRPSHSVPETTKSPTDISLYRGIIVLSAFKFS